jgi:hypothetical protein
MALRTASLFSDGFVMLRFGCDVKLLSHGEALPFDWLPRPAYHATENEGRADNLVSSKASIKNKVHRRP